MKHSYHSKRENFISHIQADSQVIWIESFIIDLFNQADLSLLPTQSPIK